MKISQRPGETIEQAQARYMETRRKYGIRNFKSTNKKFTGDAPVSKLQSRYELYLSVYEHLQNQGETFASQYKLTYHAIQKRIEDKVAKALDSKYPEQEKEKSMYASQYTQQIIRIRDKIQDAYGTLDLTSEQKDEIIKKLIATERDDMERHLAIQVATDYISGMSDTAFSELAVRTGVLTKEELENAKTRIPPEEAADNHVVAQLVKNMELVEDADNNEKKPDDDDGR